jgi:hypothetical protein
MTGDPRNKTRPGQDDRRDPRKVRVKTNPDRPEGRSHPGR